MKKSKKPREQSRERGKAALFLVPLGVLAACGAGAAGYAAWNYVPRIAPGTEFQGIAMGGRTRAQAEAVIRDWWAAKQQEELAITADGLQGTPQNWTPAKLGLKVDAAKTVSQAAFDDFWSTTRRNLVKGEAGHREIQPVLRADVQKVTALAPEIRPLLKPASPARAVFDKGAVVRIPESASAQFDPAKQAEAAIRAVEEGAPVPITLKTAPKKVSDKSLADIRNVVSSMSTDFNTGKATRCHNIQLAVSLLNGKVLLPGEKFSFNGFLGQRTAKKGFQEAGVYKNGRHDFDIGGGICQVSTTLYNAVLRANLKVVSRSPHTYPVPYVPLGQDAAVSFPDPDFSFVNTSDHAIAISGQYEPGRLTFRILGPEPNLETYRFIHKELRSWSHPVRYISDPDLSPGHEKVVDKGGMGHEVATWRVTLRDGKEVRRESLGVSTYNGGPMIIAHGPARPARPAAAAPTSAPGQP